jgi:hypothetical protein
MFLKVSLIFALLAVFGQAKDTKKSISTTNFGKVYAPGDLMWEDNFETFDPLKWDYEANMNGGGVRKFTRTPQY